MVWRWQIPVITSLSLVTCIAWAKSETVSASCARRFSELKNPKAWDLQKEVDVQVAAVFSDKTLTPDQRVHSLFEVLMIMMGLPTQTPKIQ